MLIGFTQQYCAFLNERDDQSKITNARQRTRAGRGFLGGGRLWRRECDIQCLPLSRLLWVLSCSATRKCPSGGTPLILSGKDIRIIHQSQCLPLIPLPPLLHKGAWPSFHGTIQRKNSKIGTQRLRRRNEQAHSLQWGSPAILHTTVKKGCPERHPLVNQISMITGRIMGLRLVVLYR